MLALVQILTGAATIRPTFAKAMEWSDSFPNLNPPEADNVPELVQLQRRFRHVLQNAGARLAKRPRSLDAELRLVLGRAP